MNVSSLIKVEILFSEKCWPKEDLLGWNYFDKFVSLLSKLNEDEQEMLLTLSQDFTWIRESMYGERMELLLDKVFAYLQMQNKNHITFMPLVAPNERGHANSGTNLYYTKLKVYELMIHEKYGNVNKIVLQESYERVNGCNDKRLICLIDDFIGSGNQAKEAISYLVTKGVCVKNIIVASFGITSEGLQNLIDFGVHVEYIDCYEKGISDRKDGKKEIYTKLMNDIELRYGIGEDYRFGYMRSESLVRMLRTPNNTFPIYWSSKFGDVTFPR